MGKEQGTAKEKINSIINATPFNKAGDLANAYLSFLTSYKDNASLPMSLNFMERAERTFQKLSDKALQLNDALLKKELEDIRKELIDSQLKTAYSLLSSKTCKALKENYDLAMIKKILFPCLNFSRALTFSLATNNKLSAHLKKIFKQNVSACDYLLIYGFLGLSEDEKKTVKNIKMRFESWAKEIREAKVDPVKAFNLDTNKTTGFLGGFDIAEWHKEYMMAYDDLIFKKQKGRPKDIFFKALQQVIHKLLITTPPKKVRRYKAWAEQLTATTINEVIVNGICRNNGLPILKAKDINNSLHSA